MAYGEHLDKSDIVNLLVMCQDELIALESSINSLVERASIESNVNSQLMYHYDFFANFWNTLKNYKRDVNKHLRKF